MARPTLELVGQTETRRSAVTPKMKEQRATEIATTLNNTDRWHAHGRGISMAVLEADLKLKIDDFGAVTERSDAIRSYHSLLKSYMNSRGRSIAVHRASKLVFA